MANRTAGRHRRRSSPQRPSSLLLDLPRGDGSHGAYLSSAIAAPGGAPSFGVDPDDGRRTFPLALTAVLTGVVAAALLGSFAPLQSTWMDSGGHGAASGLPPNPLVPPASGTQTSGAQASGSQAPGSQAPGSRTPATQTPVPGASSPPPPARARHARARAASARPSGQVIPAPSRSDTSSGTAKPRPEVVVRYLVDSQGTGGFEGQVEVINQTSQPVNGWQIAIALPDDTVTNIWNAGGFVSNHILLLQPASAAQVVLPANGTLNVFFVARGTETIPTACAFNDIPCG